MNNKRKPQRRKEYGRDAKRIKKNGYKKREIAKEKTIDETLLFERTEKKLKEKSTYLLDLKVGLIRDNKKIYAVIFKKKESVSHSHCIEATKIIQEIIKSEGYDEGDYTITVSSAGFRWKFEDGYELFEDMPIKIKYVENGETITAKALLKEAKSDYIVIENEDKSEIKILKKDVIKARLNC